MLWTHKLKAPWQSAAWREQMRSSLRTNQFLRMIENRWVTTESEFVELDAFDACLSAYARPVLANPKLPIWVGVDAGYKHDSTGIAICADDQDAKRVRLIRYFVFQPSPDNPLDFEVTIERTLLDLRATFDVREIRFDPYQLVTVAQRLSRSGLADG